MEDNNKLYDMKLHETIIIHKTNPSFQITRVPGGWIYYTEEGNYRGDKTSTATFVRWDNDLLINKEYK